MDHSHRAPNTNWTQRPQFRENQRLTPERLNRVHDYHAERLRLTLLGVAGSGVVYGFKIATDKDRQCKIQDGRLYIGCGLAIDCLGRQLYWPGGWIDVDDLCGERPACEDEYTLWVHYAERPVSTEGPCGASKEEADWIEEGVVFTLTRGCSPVCDGCPDDCCDENQCVEPCDYLCGRIGAMDAGSGDNCIPGDNCLDNLCKQAPELCPGSCGDWFYDNGNGLQLACVEICDLAANADNCGPRLGFYPSEPKVCDYRSYVYRNPLLYELIQRCHIHLARVAGLEFPEKQPGIDDWLNSTETQRLDWTVFVQGVKRGLQVMFTRPIQTGTLNKSSLIFTVITQEYESLFLDTLRIPIDTITMLGQEDSCAKGVHILFDNDWLERQIESVPQWPSRFNSEAIVEFTVRGAMLRDNCDRMLDGRPLDIPDDQHGQEMPGDDFVVAFYVSPKPRDEATTPPVKEKQAD